MAVLALASNIYINVKRMRSNIGSLQKLKEQLTELEAKEALTSREIVEKERLKELLLAAQQKISFWELASSFGFIDWVFVGGSPLIGEHL